MSFLPRIRYGVNSSRNPGKHWIPGQARNDKLDRIYVVMYKLEWATRDGLEEDPSTRLLFFPSNLF